MNWPFTPETDGVRLYVLLSPKASGDVVEGIVTRGDKAYLKARVRALPERGQANTALVKLVAKWLKLSKSSVEVVAGHQARVKTLMVSGDQDEIIESLQQLLYLPTVKN